MCCSQRHVYMNAEWTRAQYNIMLDYFNQYTLILLNNIMFPNLHDTIYHFISCRPGVEGGHVPLVCTYPQLLTYGLLATVYRYFTLFHALCTYISYDISYTYNNKLTYFRSTGQGQHQSSLVQLFRVPKSLPLQLHLRSRICNST